MTDDRGNNRAQTASPPSATLGEPVTLAYARRAHPVPTPMTVRMALAVAVFTPLASLIVIAVSSSGPSEGCGPRSRTRAQLTSVCTSLATFKMHMGRYPTSQEDLAVLLSAPSDDGVAANWLGPYARPNVLRDTWGAPLSYRCPGITHPESYDLASAGKNGVFGDSDDLVREAD